MNNSLSIQINDQIATVLMNRPDVHNAFDAQLIEDLTSALVSLSKNDDVRVVILTGQGASFSAGADLNWMRGMVAADEESNYQDSLALARLMRTLNELPKPTIARVNGAAFGGGVGLIACCDIAIAHHDAKFGLTESKLGLLPAVISPYVIEAIGARQSRRWFATAEIFDAVTAETIGLVHQVASADQLDVMVQQQSNFLLKAGPYVGAYAKRLIREVTAITETTQQDQYTSRLIAQLRVSDEGQEGLNAFLEKRKPGWTKPFNN